MSKAKRPSWEIQKNPKRTDKEYLCWISNTVSRAITTDSDQLCGMTNDMSNINRAYRKTIPKKSIPLFVFFIPGNKNSHIRDFFQWWLCQCLQRMRKELCARAGRWIEIKRLVEHSSDRNWWKKQVCHFQCSNTIGQRTIPIGGERNSENKFAGRLSDLIAKFIKLNKRN